jgi:hypothetical protein
VLRLSALNGDTLDLSVGTDSARLLALACVLIDDRGEVGVGTRREKISIVMLGQWEEVGDLQPGE